MEDWLRSQFQGGGFNAGSVASLQESPWIQIIKRLAERTDTPLAPPAEPPPGETPAATYPPLQSGLGYEDQRQAIQAQAADALASIVRPDVKLGSGLGSKTGAGGIPNLPQLWGGFGLV
jgi:hypothetical protein